jgi:hypothetical protein
VRQFAGPRIGYIGAIKPTRCATLESIMRFAKTAIAAAAFISVAVSWHCTSADAQNRQALEDFSSARPGSGEGGWTARQMRRAQPLPLPKADPDVVRQIARSLDGLAPQSPGSTEPYPPPRR